MSLLRSSSFRFRYLICANAFRIPLAKILIQTTIDISKHHKSVYVVAIIALIIEAAWSVWYSFTCIAIYVKWTPGSAGEFASPLFSPPQPHC